MERKEIQVRVDGYTRVCLTVIAVLLTVMIVALWADGVPPGEQAMAGKVITEERRPPGPGSQRAEIVTAQKQTTAKLAELIAVLKSGDVKVRVTEMPAVSEGGTDAARSGKK